MDAKEKDRIYKELTTNILAARYEDIDQATVSIIKNCILDTIGCALGSARLPDILALVEMVAEWGGKKEASIIGHGIQAPVHDVAFVNCTMCRGFDRAVGAYIFNNRVAPHHASETLTPAALALGESKGINGKELIVALAVGDDLTARLHLANDHSLPGEYHSQERSAPIRLPQHKIPTPTFGAAAMAGRILGLTPLQLKNTLGLVGNSEGFGGGISDGAPTFKIGQGTMARGGIISALMAKKGWTGAIDPFFDPGDGLFSDRLDHPEMLTKDLGKIFYVESVFKLYPGGWPTQAPTAAAIAISDKYHLQTAEIDEVILRTSPGISTATHYARPYKIGFYPTGDALFSYKYAVASALVRGTSRNLDYTEEAISNPFVQALIKKVKLALAELPASEGVELEVKMTDGTRYSQRVARAHGEPSSPLSQNTLISKFMEQVKFTQIISKEKAEKLIDLTQNLEDVDNVSKILELSVTG